MVLAASLALLLFQSEALALTRDSKGNPTVTKEQWTYVHQVLESRNSQWVLNIVHPKHPLKVRYVNTSFPNEDGSIDVNVDTWNRATMIERLKYQGFYDVRHPGYTYTMAEQMDPDVKSPYETLIMKGLMYYTKETPFRKGFRLNMYPSERASKRYQRDYKRLSPITYIRMEAREGRLWLAEISSYVPAE